MVARESIVGILMFRVGIRWFARESIVRILIFRVVCASGIKWLLVKAKLEF